MRVRIQFPGALTSALLLAGIVGCSTVMSQSSDELLTNVSFHILVNEAEPIPSSGTYEIDTKLFKIDENLDLDLASIEQRVSRALLCGFEGKGLRQATENPDLIVNYAVAVDAELTAADLNEAFSSETPINFPEPEGDQDLSYRKGVLILDIVDAKSLKHLWRGAIMADARLDVSEREKDERVQQGVNILLQHYPQPILTEK